MQLWMDIVNTNNDSDLLSKRRGRKTTPAFFLAKNDIEETNKEKKMEKKSHQFFYKWLRDIQRKQEEME